MGGRVPRLLAAGLILALFGVPSSSALLEFQATYEIHEDEGTVSYREVGGAMPAIDCDGEWSVVLSSVSSTPSDRRLLEIEVDADSAKVTVTRQVDGTHFWETYACEDGSATVKAPAAEWRSQQAAATDGSEGPLLPTPLAEQTCSEDPTVTVERLAPFTEETTRSTKAPADASPVCVEARAAAEIPDGDDVPFTGTVEATVTDEDGQEVSSQTCLVVFGTCWDEGEAEADLPQPRPQGDAEWTLTCETKPLFAPYYPAVGTFSCQTWLGQG